MRLGKEMADGEQQMCLTSWWAGPLRPGACGGVASSAAASFVPLDVILLFLLSHLAHERCRYHGNLLVWVQLC